MSIVNVFLFGVKLYSCLCWWAQLWGAAGEQCLRDPCRAENYRLEFHEKLGYKAYEVWEIKKHCQEPSP